MNEIANILCISYNFDPFELVIRYNAHLNVETIQYGNYQYHQFCDITRIFQ